MLARGERIPHNSHSYNYYKLYTVHPYTTLYNLKVDLYKDNGCSTLIFRERERSSRSAQYMLSPVSLSSVTLVRPTQAVHIFGNISTALGTLAIH